MSPAPAGVPEPAPDADGTAGHHCTGCGRAADVCPGCRHPLDPPRHCPHCGGRLRVVVTPGGFTARCRAHGPLH